MMLHANMQGELRDDDVHRLLYATDASLYAVYPVAVAFPKSKEDVILIVRVGLMFGLPLTPRAAGTSLSGQAVGPGLVIDMGRYMNKVISVDVERRVARVQPGVVRDDLNRQLKPHGLFFSPETSTSDRCMIGGMVGNNSVGTRSIRYGSTRDHVLSLDVVLADASEHTLGIMDRAAYDAASENMDALGTALRELKALIGESHADIVAAFPKPEITRRNTGYAIDLLERSWLGSGAADPNLAEFFCGTEGTLGFVTEIELDLDVLPGSTAVFAAHFETVVESMHATVELVAMGPSAVELMDKRILDLAKLNPEQDRNRWFIEGDPGALLIVEFEGADRAAAEAKVTAAIERMTTLGMGYAHRAIPRERASSAWALRVAGLGVLFGKPGDVKPITIVEDTAVAVAELPAFVERFEGLMRKYEIDSVYYGHASVGELHLRPELNPKDADDAIKSELVAGEVADLVREFRASLSGEHGDGRLRSPYIDRSMNGPVSAWLERIKYAFDPMGIMNPGNIVDAAPMLNDWRYDAAYTDLPQKTEFAYEAAGGMQQAVERCNGAGVCRRPAEAGGTMCPSYMVTREEAETTRGRSNLFRRLLQQGPEAMYGSDELYDALDLCVSCKGCKSDCPASVDMATLKAEFLQGRMDQQGPTFRSRAFAMATEWAKPAQLFPGGAWVGNVMQRVPPFSWIGSKVLGLTSKRQAPAIAPRSFHKLAKTMLAAGPSDPVGTVCLFIDEFTDRYEPELGIAAVELLHAGGYRVVAPEVAPSGRTFLSKGFVRDARTHILKNIEILGALPDDVPIVGIEPSAVLTLLDEGVDLVRDEPTRAKAKQLASRVALVQDFVAAESAAGRWCGTWTTASKKVLLHGHCHQKAQVGVGATQAALALPPNYEVQTIPSGCCGMAGSFGYEAEHYETSMKIGELVLFPAVREAEGDVHVVAPGTSCRHQIADGTGREAVHPIVFLRDALA